MTCPNCGSKEWEWFNLGVAEVSICSKCQCGMEPIRFKDKCVELDREI